jgi:hypothetical protein
LQKEHPQRPNPIQTNLTSPIHDLCFVICHSPPSPEFLWRPPPRFAQNITERLTPHRAR